MQDEKSGNIKATEAGVVNFEDAISLTGYGKYQIAVLLTAGGLLMAVIMETLAMSYILPTAQCDLNLTLSEKGMISGISFLGVVLSSHMWGFIGDTLGRRKLIVITTYISALAGYLSALAPVSWLFIILRFFNGFFVGGASAVIYAYLGEFHNNHHRPMVIQWTATFVAIGTVMLPALAWPILSMKWTFPIAILGIDMRPWRLLIMIYSTPSLIFATCLWKLPESPKFLWVKGKSEEALDILRNVYSWNTGNPVTLYSVLRLAEPGSDEKPAFLKDQNDNFDTTQSNKEHKSLRFLKLMWNQTAPLFRYPHLSNTALCATLQFGVFASSSGFLMWLPDFLNKISNYMVMHPNNTVMLCKALDEYNSIIYNVQEDEISNCVDTVDEDVFKISLIFGCVFAVSYIFLGSAISFIGKKLLLVIYLVGTGIGAVSILFVEGYTDIIILLCFFLSIGSCVSVINAIVVDLYPTQYRAMAMALTLMIGRLGAVAGSHIVGYLLETFCDIAFYTAASLHIGLLLVTFLVPVPLFIWRQKKGAQ